MGCKFFENSPQIMTHHIIQLYYRISEIRVVFSRSRQHKNIIPLLQLQPSNLQFLLLIQIIEQSS